MIFLFGFIIGLIVAVLIIVTLAYFRVGIEHNATVITTQISNAGPRPSGHIFMPESEADIVRKEIIKKNQAEGKDTPFSELA